MAKVNKKILIPIVTVVTIILLIVCVFGIYASIYYKAENVDAYLVSSDSVVISNSNVEYTAFLPKGDYDSAFIFYPGAKVEYTSYAPVLYNLAENGIAAFAIKMPYNFAILDINRANEVFKNYPQLKDENMKVYIGGHSLGGAMAATYASKNADKLDGLVLLAAYSTKDLSNNGLEVLSIYGSNDKVLNADKYNQYKENLPSNYVELVIAGGNHSGCAYYGPQKGDGEATITKDVQIQITVDAIKEFILN